ncbi:putative carbohydrate esterase family 3 protein [Rosellinia necatrix]|uniref:Putative carbohydrate esterase family 3 protein n=1 Tax=Rosellinia necatrix TaxID=77044 RepID=A0A1S7UNT5_ROSNE|nr:putative carbohydrate esterase family 3 protein [Rosellinia necatrix]
MLIQSRLGGLGAQWRQLSKVGKIVIISASVFFLLAVLWGTGTVDVDYVRSQFKGAPHGGEPIPQEKTDTPIIDGVPNDENDRPIPDGIIEGGEQEQEQQQQQQTAEKGSEHESTVHGASQKQDATATPEPIPEPIEAAAEQSSAQQNAMSSSLTTTTTAATAAVEPANTEPTKPHPGPIAGGIPLRIMFIGASMTLGDPPQSAYRMRLREWLVSLGNPVNCVGTNRFGHFKDNDVQGYASTPIEELHEKAAEAVPAMQPNLIIVNAGSSDCFQWERWGSAGALERTRALVDFLFAASPRAAVVLSTLVTSADPRFERCILSVNAQIRQVAADVRRAGRPLVLSEQHYDQGLPGRVTPALLKPDKMHPTAAGWDLMADVYMRDIRDADARGWIVAPVDNGILADGDAERDLEDAARRKEEEEGKEKAEGRAEIALRARRERRGRVSWEI